MSALPPTRNVHHADALVWLAAHAPLEDASVITSLPDISEFGGMTPAAWKTWFEAAALQTLQAVPDLGVTIFFQSDIRHQGLWIDKSALITRAAERAGVELLFHKIVCRKPAGSITFSRASYSHLLGFSRSLRPQPRPGKTTADVLPDAGYMPGKKSMGVAACVDAVRFIQNETTSRVIVDPFCGFGTVLAVANALGVSAIGVDRSQRMCRKARGLELSAEQLAADPERTRAAARGHGVAPRAQSAPGGQGGAAAGRTVTTMGSLPAGTKADT